MENLKKDWQDANVSIPRDTDSIISITNGRRRTALESLAERYRRFSVVGLALILLSISYSLNARLFPGNTTLRIAMSVAFGLYALTAAVMDHWLYNGIRSIDVVTMPVKEVIGKALFYRKRHLQFIAILLPMVLGIIGVFAWNMDNLYFRMGILAGFIAGTAIGVIQLMSFLADYRAIISED